MKTKTVLALYAAFMAIVVVLFIAEVKADTEISAKLITNSYITDDDMFRRGAGYGIQIDVTPKDTGYFYASYGTVGVYPKGKAFNYTMYGLGVGNKVKISKYFKVFGQIGYNIIKNDYAYVNNGFGNEGLLQYFNDRFSVWLPDGQYHVFDSYDVHNENAFSGTVGIEMLYPITKNFSTSFSLAYNYLKIKEELHAYKTEWDYENTGNDWEIGLSNDYSSIQFSAGLNYAF